MNQPLIGVGQARLNITWNGQNGDLTEPVPFDASDTEIKAWAAEALRGGDVAGVGADPGANLADFVVDRFPATDEIPFHRLFVRPKTPFGMLYATGGGHGRPQDRDHRRSGGARLPPDPVRAQLAGHASA